MGGGGWLLADTDRKIGRWRQTHMKWTQSLLSRHSGHISEKRETIWLRDLSLLCVRQKSLSESNLSRSASVAPAAPENSVLFHPAASCGTTQHHLTAGRSGAERAAPPVSMVTWVQVEQVSVSGGKHFNTKAEQLRYFQNKIQINLIHSDGSEQAASYLLQINPNSELMS